MRKFFYSHNITFIYMFHRTHLLIPLSLSLVSKYYRQNPVLNIANVCSSFIAIDNDVFITHYLHPFFFIILKNVIMRLFKRNLIFTIHCTRKSRYCTKNSHNNGVPRYNKLSKLFTRYQLDAQNFFVNIILHSATCFEQ
jgi:hypothetical protein